MYSFFFFASKNEIQLTFHKINPFNDLNMECQGRGRDSGKRKKWKKNGKRARGYMMEAQNVQEEKFQLNPLFCIVTWVNNGNRIYQQTKFLLKYTMVPYRIIRNLCIHYYYLTTAKEKNIHISNHFPEFSLPPVVYFQPPWHSLILNIFEHQALVLSAGGRTTG